MIWLAALSPYTVIATMKIGMYLVVDERHVVISAIIPSCKRKCQHSSKVQNAHCRSSVRVSSLSLSLTHTRVEILAGGVDATTLS